jgi:hypothetical protein
LMTLFFLSDSSFKSTSKGFSCRGMCNFIRRIFAQLLRIYFT